MTTNHYLAAERELAAAINDSTLVDDLPLEEANTYDGRRARYRASVAMDAARVHATLALVDHLRLVSKIDEVDRNARAYGWEVGRGQEPGDQLVTTEGNPFVDQRCIRTLGAWCPIHHTAHWMADRTADAG